MTAFVSPVEYAGHAVFSSVSTVHKISHASTKKSTIACDRLLLHLSVTRLEVGICAATHMGVLVGAR